MDEPVHCDLRTARSSALTSPEAVTAPLRRNGPPTQPPTRAKGKGKPQET